MNVSKIFHREENRIKVDFPYNQQITGVIKQINDARWSQTHRAWHIPYSKEAWAKLKSLFPEITFEQKAISTEQNLQSKNTTEAFQNSTQKPVFVENVIQKSTNEINNAQFEKIGVFEDVFFEKTKIYIEVIGKKIIVRMPKNDIDVKFLLTLRYSRWDKLQAFWSIPHYPGNVEMLQNYFGKRLFSFKIHEQIQVNSVQSKIHQIGKNEVLVFKTNTKRLKVIFGYNPALSKSLKTIPYHTWDSKNKWWTIPYSEQFLREIKQKIADLKLVLKYEEEAPKSDRVLRITPSDIPNYRTCPEEYKMKLVELRYSEKTIKVYCNLFEEFINYYPTFDLKTIDETLIIKFLRFLVTERKISSSYQNQSINAIKFYYERVLGGKRKFYFIDRPNKEKTLPTVLSTEEVTAIFKATKNIKHKAILMTIYSAGLRISEVSQLKIKDIDSQRMQIRVEQSKGKKDRYTLLSTKTLTILRAYFLEFKPTDWLFEGQIKGEKYAARSIQNIFQAVVEKTGIKKDVSVHTLRHSFATHLLENGTDIRYIQSLLGHSSSKTTEIYTHITTKGFDQIKSPIDSLDI